MYQIELAPGAPMPLHMLDVLEAFLNYPGPVILRLDATTKVKQINRSTRSGGISTESVAFYDSDSNPTRDAQGQVRCYKVRL
ncbi:E1a binding protein P400 [Culex quinquefasciatus]|uniref:E1a binding protein P400 n=1 Tax=Culex quinquefasciatus TaxID=7176 RepID=B0WN50_CULQU|nr:E1a binding protein P400 [Culex quinquefasciatus]|eukprot:XP_001850134.1 E1a binding protein P400 [Culex quinquefasciatus]